MVMDTFALKGNIVYSKSSSELNILPQHTLVCGDGRVAGVFEKLPEKYAHISAQDLGDSIIMPGMADLHLHAPQFAFRGLGMDLELLDWLNTHTFPEEAKYSNMAYAQKAYGMFVDALLRSGTTRACVFATVHTPATLMLMDSLEESGIVCHVGKVNMDRNCPDFLCEKDASTSLEDTRAWVSQCKERYENTKPILTPRFIPSCSDGLMLGLAEIQRQSGLAVQSHLSENPSEIEWVKQLCPQAKNYADAYLRSGLLGGEDCPTIMAHCVYSEGDELRLLKEQGVWVAHCPVSNTCLSSGVAPVQAFLQSGIHTGLGSDVAGGYSLSLFDVMVQAIEASKLRWRLQDQSLAPLSFAQAFYLATCGGGSFFGRVGSFEEGYEFDALVLNDSDIPCPFELSVAQRIERLVYLGAQKNITHKYVAGRRLW